MKRKNSRSWKDAESPKSMGLDCSRERIGAVNSMFHCPSLAVCSVSIPVKFNIPLQGAKDATYHPLQRTRKISSDKRKGLFFPSWKWFNFQVANLFCCYSRCPFSRAILDFPGCTQQAGGGYFFGCWLPTFRVTFVITSLEIDRYTGLHREKSKVVKRNALAINTLTMIRWTMMKHIWLDVEM